MENSRNEPSLSYESHAAVRGVLTWDVAHPFVRCLCTCAVTTVSHAGALEPIRLTVTVPQCLSAGHPYCTKSRSQSTEAVTLAAQLCRREATESVL